MRRCSWRIGKRDGRDPEVMPLLMQDHDPIPLQQRPLVHAVGRRVDQAAPHLQAHQAAQRAAAGEQHAAPLADQILLAHQAVAGLPAQEAAPEAPQANQQSDQGDQGRSGWRGVARRPQPHQRMRRLRVSGPGAAAPPTPIRTGGHAEHTYYSHRLRPDPPCLGSSSLRRAAQPSQNPFHLHQLRRPNHLPSHHLPSHSRPPRTLPARCWVSIAKACWKPSAAACSP